MRTSQTQAFEAETRRTKLASSIDNSLSQISKQQEQIRVISEENDQIKKQISTISGSHYDYVKADKLAVLQGEVDALERRYQFEKMRKNDLTKNYQLARIELLHSRKKKGGVNVEKEQDHALQCQVSILENRLDQALGKFNDALAYNKELRDQIDIIREERRVFQRVHKKMEEDLRASKRIMAERIEQSNKDMDERDEYVRQVEQMKRAIEAQHQEYTEQLHVLDKAMMEIKTMREEHMELQLELEAREYKFEGTIAEGTSQLTPSCTPTKDNFPQHPMQCGDDFSEYEESSEAAQNAKVDQGSGTIQDICEQMHAALQEGDMVKLLEEYQRLGDKNYSLYRCINELTSSKELVNKEIVDLQRLLEEDSECNAKHRRLIKKLEEQLAETESKLEQMQYSMVHLRDALTAATDATKNLYTCIGCSPIKDSVTGDEMRCTEANLLSFLGIIEERATQILCAFHGLQSRSTAQHTVFNPTSPTTPCKVRTPRRALAGEEIGADGEHKGISTVGSPVTLNTVSVQRIVRVADLPSANLATGDHDALFTDLRDDQIVLHEDIRRQMEARLISKREREERVHRRKKETMVGGGKSLCSNLGRRVK